MACLDEIVAFLDEELRLGEVPDYPGAVNGLQMQGEQEVRRVAAAVDASLPVVKKAVEAGMDLLVVHHGMFWKGARPVTGATYEKFKTAMEAGLAIYSAHIPLDVHPVLGNNARLSAALELQDTEPFFEWKGTRLGIRGIFPGSLDQLTERVTEVLGSPPHVCAAGSDAAGTVGVISGGGGEFLDSRPGGRNRYLPYRRGPALELYRSRGTGTQCPLRRALPDGNLRRACIGGFTGGKIQPRRAVHRSSDGNVEGVVAGNTQRRRR